MTDAAFASRNDKEPPKRLVPDPDTAPFLLRAFEVFAETGGYNRAADYLRSVTPRKWTVDGVRHVLQNEVYTGVLRFGENVNPTAYEPIVSETLWEAVLRAKENRPARSVKQNMKDPRPYYLRHLVFCVHYTSEVRKELSAVEKRSRETEKKIGQITMAIEDGGAMRALLERLQTLEAERTGLTTPAAAERRCAR